MQDQKWKKQYIMFDLNKLNSDIWYWENTVSSPENLIFLINSLNKNIDSYEKIPPWEPWLASDNKNIVYGAVKMIKKDSINKESSNKILNQNSLYIVNSLSMAAEMCFDKYMDIHNIDKSKYVLDLSYLPIKRWDVGSSMGPHSDSSELFPNLKFTIITYLNDDYEGGEIEFPEYNINLKPKAGSTIMFPSNIIHLVKPVISGERYMSTNSVNMI